MTAEERNVAELYRSLGPVIYRRCLRFLKTREAAQDATQEVFLKLLKHGRRLAPDESSLPWIYQTATNHCLNVIRESTRRDMKHSALEVAASVSGSTFPERQLSQKILLRFDRTTQAVAIGALIDGMQQAELATALGVSSKTVSRKLSRFLEQAKKFIQRTDS